MKHLVEFPLKDGSNVVIEVDAPESEGTVRAGRGDTLLKSKETFEDALSQALPVTGLVFEQLRNLTCIPEEVHISFGIKFSSDFKAIIASISAEANFNIELHWSRKKPETGSQPLHSA